MVVAIDGVERCNRYLMWRDVSLDSEAFFRLFFMCVFFFSWHSLSRQDR